jgi:hypothetical protein
MRGNEEGIAGCTCAVMLVVFNALVGGWSVDYLLTFFLSKDIPFLADALIGLFVAQLSVPAAIIIAVLRHFGAL